MDSKKFKQIIYDYYALHGRAFAWRETTDPYKIVVSEIMLQQTQTSRVEIKYESFLNAFPDFKSLATATLGEVLTQWQGLGYNRRGKYLHEIAQKVVNEFEGTLPKDPEVLETLPGIGPNTARSIASFTWNTPTVFIETNIRSVYIFHFFNERVLKGEKIHDKEILELIEKTLDTENPRQWYYALMDYGVYLKKTHKNPSQKSAHYKKQSKFKGSSRQVRSSIIRQLTNTGGLMELDALFEKVIDDISKDQKELGHKKILKHIKTLQKEKFITLQDNIIKIL